MLIEVLSGRSKNKKCRHTPKGGRRLLTKLLTGGVQDVDERVCQLECPFAGGDFFFRHCWSKRQINCCLTVGAINLDGVFARSRCLLLADSLQMVEIKLETRKILPFSADCKQSLFEGIWEINARC